MKRKKIFIENYICLHIKLMYRIFHYTEHVYHLIHRVGHFNLFTLITRKGSIFPQKNAKEKNYIILRGEKLVTLNLTLKAFFKIICVKSNFSNGTKKIKSPQKWWQLFFRIFMVLWSSIIWKKEEPLMSIMQHYWINWIKLLSSKSVYLATLWTW